MGRDDLFYQLETAARLQHVVVLSGPGGTGKTELAKGFARWWRDTGGVDDPRLMVWHSFEAGGGQLRPGRGDHLAGPGRVRRGLRPSRRSAATGPGEPTAGPDASAAGVGQLRVSPGDARPCRTTPPLDEAACEALKDFLESVRPIKERGAVASRAQEEWLGNVGRITVEGLNRVEAAEYASYLLAPYPAAQRRRERRSFGELLDWLDGHPLAMRLTLPHLDTTDPDDLLADLRGTTPLPTADAPDAGRTRSLAASITYSYVHLTEQTRRLLPAVSPLYGIADENLLLLMSAAEMVPARFAHVGQQEWTAVLQDAARVGLLLG